MPRWRVLCDANVFISYLLQPVGNGTIQQVVRFCFSDECQLVLTSELLSEIRVSTESKPKLMSRIDPRAVARLIEALNEIGEFVTVKPAESAPRVRDIKDTYLLQASRAGDVDVLVTGDLDLRALRDEISKPLIVNPAELLVVLQVTYNT